MILNNFWYAVATQVGMIVGVGMFGLPFVASRSGFLVVCAYLVAFTAVFVLLHLMFGEIVLRTKERHRLVGYAGIYLGKFAKKFMLVETMLMFIGGMLAYILVGGTFLHDITSGIFGSAFDYQIIFWALMSVLVAMGLKTVKWSELAMFVIVSVIIVFLFLASAPHITVAYLEGFSARDIFLPYGIVLFALAGGAAVPILRDILQGEEHLMKKAILYGTLAPAVMYVLFVIAVVGVSGSLTSEDGFSGLHGILGEPVIFWGIILGVLMVASSYLVFGLYLKDTLRYDMGISDRTALLWTLFSPLALLMLEWRSFIEIISFLGALFLGVEGIFLIMIYRRAREKGDRAPEYDLRVSRAVLYALIVIFVSGAAYALLHHSA